MKKRVSMTATASFLLVPVAWAWAAGPGPTAVSPGSSTRVLRVEARCPTFSWGEVDGARAYEVVVYQVDEEGATTERVLRQTFPGSVESWTPSVDRCLERGQRYAWAVRAEAGTNRWSEASFFEVVSQPAGDRVEEALAVLRDYLRAVGARGTRGPATPAAENRDRAELDRSGTADPAGDRSIATALPATALAVDGTVTAAGFAGDGSGLTGVVADSVTGISVEDNPDSPNIIGGYSGNSVTGGVVGAVVGGGGQSGLPNRVTDDSGTVGGGINNQAGDGSDGDPADAAFATVGGGQTNTASGSGATVAGGGANTAAGFASTVGGGQGNTADDGESTVGGGFFNFAGGSRATISGGGSHVTSGPYATIAGGFGNTASGVKSAIGGGGRTNDADANTGNRVTDDFGVVGGGGDNQAGDDAGTTADRQFATVAGGDGNTASGHASTVGGGQDNTASAGATTVSGGQINVATATWATVGGGQLNDASGLNATVGGGLANTASGENATVAGGSNGNATGLSSTVSGGFANTASGSYSYAAGHRAKANHDGAFVWGDSTNADFASTAANQFLLRAAGGVGIGTNTPGAPLEVASSGFLVGKFSNTGVGADHTALVDIANGDGVVWRQGVGGTGNGLGLEGGEYYIERAGSPKVVIAGSGDVGIGIDAPWEKLDVAGNIRFGESFKVAAVGATEQLRIIRGRVNSDGTCGGGQGFGCGRSFAGTYTVTFSSSFSAAPAVVVTPLNAASNYPSPNVHSLTAGGFGVTLLCTMSSCGDNGDLRDNSFSFIAMGPR